MLWERRVSRQNCARGRELPNASRDPIQTVANLASKTIDEAIALLNEYRNGGAGLLEGGVPRHEQDPHAKAPVAQALARHKAAQAPIDAHFGQIDDEALGEPTFHRRERRSQCTGRNALRKRC
jgi:hypothetical protein